jgi:hypothetical protein
MELSIDTRSKWALYLVGLDIVCKLLANLFFVEDFIWWPIALTYNYDCGDTITYYTSSLIQLTVFTVTLISLKARLHTWILFAGAATSNIGECSLLGRVTDYIYFMDEWGDGQTIAVWSVNFADLAALIFLFDLISLFIIHSVSDE